MKGLFNNRGEGYINTGVKIIIAVVIGALILGGLYLLFAGDNGVFAQLNDNVEGQSRMYCRYLYGQPHRFLRTP